MSVPLRKRDWSRLGAIGLAASLLGVDTACLALLCAGSRVAPLVTHVVISIVANVIAWRRSEAASAASATLRMAAMLLPFLGPVAPLAAVILLLAQLLQRSVQPDAATWHEHLFPNLAADPITDRMDAITRRQSAPDEDVESFYDVLRWGTLAEREHVISLISRSFRAEFAPVLREALASDDLGLRAQAAAGLSLLETRTSAKLSALQQSYREARTEQARERAAIALAHVLSDAAHSGLYDELRSVEMRREIVSLLAPVVDARPGDPGVGAMLGRTMIHLGDLEGAVATLAHAVETSGTGEQADAAFSWLLEGLFRQGDFVHLAELLSRRHEQAAALVARDGPLAPALSFWGAAT